VVINNSNRREGYPLNVKAREGELIENLSGSIFDVKGLIHPPRRIVAFIRFVPDPKGDRKRGKMRYRKVYALSRRYVLLQKAFPTYLMYDSVFDEHLCEVPVKAIKHHYKPVDRLIELRHCNELDKVESQTFQFAELLKESANIEWDKIGISGSVLVKLHKPDSDIDPIVYGSENCRKVYLTLKGLLEDEKSAVDPYNLEELRKLFDFRSRDTAMLFEDFVRTESRKVMQGKFLQRDYSMRFVKDWNEIEEQYGTTRYVNEGYARVKASVIDDSESIFTPCHYKISHVELLEGIHLEPIKEIVSFRARFCEQARNGETVIAQGKVERVQKEGTEEYYRLLIGGNVSDYVILV